MIFRTDDIPMAKKKKRIKELPMGTRPMPDGSATHILLSKDRELLVTFLANLEKTEIGRDQYLAYRVSEESRWENIKGGEEKLQSVCNLCKGAVYWWANERQQWLHCDCTLLVAPSYRPLMANIKTASSEKWSLISDMALAGIKQWLALQ